MKKFVCLIAALLVLSLTGCSQEEVDLVFEVADALLSETSAPEEDAAPETEAETEKETESEAVEQGTTVYITPTGKKYHLRSTCAGKNAKATTLEAAIAAGLGPCGSCAD